MTAPPRELLADLVTALRTGTMPPAAARAWFCDAVREWERAQDREWETGIHLDRTLGLTGSKARAARDAALAAAAAELAPDEQPRQAARELVKQLNHFEAVTLKNQRRHPSRKLSGWKLALYRAFETGCKIPRDLDYLAGIIEKNFSAAWLINKAEQSTNGENTNAA